MKPGRHSENFNIDKVVHFCLVNFFQVEIDEITSDANLVATFRGKNLGHVGLHSVAIKLGRVNQIILLAIAEVDKTNAFQWFEANAKLFPLDDILEGAR